MKKLIFGLMFFNFAQAAQQQQAQAPAQQAASQAQSSYQEQAREQIMQAISIMPAVLANLISQYAEGVDINLALENLNKLKGSQFAEMYVGLLGSLTSNDRRQGFPEEFFRIYQREFGSNRRGIDKDVLIAWGKTLETKDPLYVFNLLTSNKTRIPHFFLGQYYYLKTLIRLEKNEQNKKLMQELMDIVDEYKDKIFTLFDVARKAALSAQAASPSTEVKNAVELKESVKNQLMRLLEPFLKILENSNPAKHEYSLREIDRVLNPRPRIPRRPIISSN